MIDKARTLELFGYAPDSLSRASNKKVVAICDGCGKVRILRRSQYHVLCHGCVMRSDEYKQKMSEACKGRKLSDEHRQKIGEANKGKKISDEHRRKISGANKGRKHSDEARKNMSKAQRGRKLSDEARKNMSEAQKGKKISDDTKRKIGEANKGKHPTDEHRRKIGEANKGKHHTDETKKKIRNSLAGKNTGEKNRNWKGGISFEPYCPKFNEAFKESIREKFGRVCFLCPTTEEENGKKLCVHHVNYDKNCLCDGVKCEFVPLCMTCHLKTNHNRAHWENLIIEKLKTETFIT